MTTEGQPEARGLRPGYHLDQLAYFRAVARARTWAEAAAGLSLTPSALSQSIADLEQKLGTELFARRGRHKVLTEQGEEVLRYAERVLFEADSLHTRLRDVEAGKRGRLRLGLVDVACLHLLPDVLRRFRKAHAVELQIRVDTTGALVRLLRAYELDLVVGVAGQHLQGLRHWTLARDELWVCAAKAPVSLHDPKLTWALYPSGSHTRRLIDAALAKRGLHPTATVESVQPAVLAQMARLDMAVTVLPGWMLRRWRLRCPESQPLIERPIEVIQRPGEAGPPAVELFEAALHAAFPG